MLYHYIQAIQHPTNDLRFQSIAVEAASVDEAYEVGGKELPLDLKDGEKAKARIEKPRPGFFRRLAKSTVKTAALLVIGSMFAGPIGAAIKTSIAFVAGLVAQWLR